MMQDMSWSSGWWIMMWATMALFWIFVLLGAAWVVGVLRRDGGAPRAESTPENLLARRLAGGEIDEPTYRRLRAAIADRGGRTARL